MTSPPLILPCFERRASISSSLSKHWAGPVKIEPFFAGDLGDRAVGAEVAAHDADVARSP